MTSDAKPDPRHPAPAAPAPAAGTWARVLKVVAGATAVLSLAFGVRQAVVYVTDHRARDRRVAELRATAAVQRGGHEYRAAWGSLREAAGVDADAVQAAREDLAMDWLENAESSQGLALGAIGDTVAPVLSRRVPDVSGPRRADLLAHLGWADFLRWRDGQTQLDPAARYREALAADPANPYAHAMLAHWLVWRGGGHQAEADAHFDAALASGRAGPYVRRLRLAASGNRGAEGDADLLRVGNAMRASGDSVGEGDRRRLWNAYDQAVFASSPARADTGAGAVSPRDLLLTYRWLFASSGYAEAQGVVYAYRLARLEEDAGDTTAALATYRAARAGTTRGDGYRARLDAAIARLSRAR